MSERPWSGPRTGRPFWKKIETGAVYVDPQYPYGLRTQAEVIRCTDVAAGLTFYRCKVLSKRYPVSFEELEEACKYVETIIALTEV